MNIKPTVIAVGLFIHCFSFTRVFEFLFEYLSETFHICWLGIGYKGEIKHYSNYTLFPSNINGGGMYGSREAAELAIDMKATTILLINDFYMLKNYQQDWSPLKAKGIKLVAYVPMDGRFIDYEQAASCLFLDNVVLYHESVKKDVQHAINWYSNKYGIKNKEQPRLNCCYHGVEQHFFKKPDTTEEIKRLKQKNFKFVNAHSSIFILNANRYNERKNLEATIRSFAKAKSGFRRKVFLVLHTPSLNDVKASELKGIIKQSGCEENIILNPLGDQYCDDNQLRELYQACDIGVNTSFGEGWGMICFEHAACGGAQIVPDHSCPGEIWKDIAVITPVAYSKKLDINLFLMYGVDESILSQQMVMLANNPDLLASTADKCCKYAYSKKFQWENIANQWNKILKH